MRGLTESTAFVTGAGGGFGRAIAVRLAESVLGAMADQIPLGRLTDPEDIAAVAYLASDDAGFVTGPVRSVSGGLTMCG